MPNADYLALGDWNAICDGCGKKFKASQLRRRWDGFMVCEKEWEPRQPQDFVRGVPDNMTPPWTRPAPADIFVSTGHSAIAGVAIAGLAIAGMTF